jgi:hypothetical protein
VAGAMPVKCRSPGHAQINSSGVGARGRSRSRAKDLWAAQVCGSRPGAGGHCGSSNVLVASGSQVTRNGTCAGGRFLDPRKGTSHVPRYRLYAIRLQGTWSYCPVTHASPGHRAVRQVWPAGSNTPRLDDVAEIQQRLRLLQWVTRSSPVRWSCLARSRASSSARRAVPWLAELPLTLGKAPGPLACPARANGSCLLGDAKCIGPKAQAYLNCCWRIRTGGPYA